MAHNAQQSGPPEPPIIICLGDLLLDVVVRTGAGEGRETVAVQPGGSAANTAAWFVWGGYQAALVAAVGADVTGALLERELRTQGVMPCLQVHSKTRSGAFVAWVTPDSYQPMATERGANDLLRWGEDEDELLHTARHLHLSGYALAHEVSCAACVAAAAAARRRDITVSLDLGAPHALRAAGPFLGDVLAALAPDVLFANEDEAHTLCALLGEGSEASQSRASGEGLVRNLLRWAPLGVLKEGRQGSRATGRAWAGEVLRHAAPSVVVSDTVGAGDAFVSGFLGVWLESAEEAGDRAVADEALTRGTATAALCLARTGGRPALP